MSGGNTHPVPIAAAFEAISRMDAAALVALCDPQVTFESRITAVEAASYEGHEGIRQYIANLADAFEFIHVDMSGLVGDDGWAVATNQFRARGRGSGVEVQQEFFVAARGHHGRLLWWGLFNSRSEALEAVR